MTVSPTLAKQYVEQRDEGYWIEGTRISLDSVVYAFLNGDAIESIILVWEASTSEEWVNQIMSIPL